MFKHLVFRFLLSISIGVGFGLVSLTVSAQSCADLFGVTSPSPNSIQVAEVDTLNGNYSNLTAVSSVSPISATSIAIDPDNQRVFFLETLNPGTTIANTKIKTIDAITGNPLINDPPNVPNVCCLQFNCTENDLYGVSTIGSNIQVTLISPETGAFTALSTLIDISDGWINNLSAVDSENNRFFLITYDGSGNPILQIIPTDGSAITTASLPTTNFGPVGLQYDRLNDRLIILNEGLNLELAEFDLTTNTYNTLNTVSLIAGVPLNPSSILTGSLAIDSYTGRLFFSGEGTPNNHNLYTVNLSTGLLINPPIGLNTPLSALATAEPCNATANFEFTNACIGQITEFTDFSVGATNWSWDFGDPTSGATNTSDEINPFHVFSSGGDFEVTLSIDGCVGVSTFTQTVTVDTPPATDIFAEDTIFTPESSYTIDAGSFPDASYFWITGSTNQSINATVSACYWVQLSVGSCVITDTICIELNSCADNLIEGGTYCSGQEVFLDATVEDLTNISYEWSPNGETTPSITVTQAGNYSVTVTSNECGELTDEATIIFNAGATVNLADTIRECAQSYIIDADVDVAGASYLWNTGATTPSITINASNSGDYWVEVSIGSCVDRDTVNVELTSIDVELGGDMTGNFLFCDNEMLTLDATPNIEGVAIEPTYLWSPNGETTPMITVLSDQPGNYEVEVRVGECLVTDQANVTFTPSFEVNLGSDTTICAGDFVVLDSGVKDAEVYIWSDNTFEDTLLVSSSGTYTVTVQNGGCFDEDEISVTVQDAQTLTLPDSLEICPAINQTLTLDAGTGATYFWTPNGETTRNISVTDPGIYTVEVIDDAGCRSMASVEVKLKCSAGITIPNAFSPNDDGLNDEFKPSLRFIDTYEFWVFDRWGNTIFYTTDTEAGWDGTYKFFPLPMSTYPWHVSYVDQDGVTQSKSGSVSLVR